MNRDEELKSGTYEPDMEYKTDAKPVSRGWVILWKLIVIIGVIIAFVKIWGSGA